MNQQELEECHLDTSLNISSSLLESSELVSEKVRTEPSSNSVSEFVFLDLTYSHSLFVFFFGDTQTVHRTSLWIPSDSFGLQAGQPQARFGSLCQSSAISAPFSVLGARKWHFKRLGRTLRRQSQEQSHNGRAALR